MRHIRAITLDLDDTLWAIGPVIQRAELKLRSWLERHVPAVAEKHPPESLQKIRKRVVREHPDKAHDLTFIRLQVLSRMGHGAGVGDDFVEEAFAAFETERNTVELYPDVPDVLEALAGRYTLVAVTNGNAKLDRIGIDHLFADCVSARQVGEAKPHRSMFDAAIIAGGHSAAETLHVGDHPEHDVHGAKLAGLDAVWLNRRGDDYPEGYHPPDHTVRDFDELHRLLTERE